MIRKHKNGSEKVIKLKKTQKIIKGKENKRFDRVLLFVWTF